jgi:predicted O-methyltransferase YrrM
MDLKTWVSVHSPTPLQKILQRAYYGIVTQRHPDQIRATWKSSFPDYERVANEFTTTDEYVKAVTAVKSLSNAGAIGIDAMHDLYVLVRNQKPSTVVETGVCNGASTFAILAALEANGTGNLYSIDYPFFSDIPMVRRRKETFPGIGQAEVPSDKEVGWLVPGRLRNRWTFHEGKSQELLPQVLREHPPDLFIHDSEHSHPYMMFELEVAWHAMDGGLIICDDITWNDAFEVFTSVRADEHGKLSRNKGYVEVP